MRISDISTGLQHVGIPTNDIAKTIAFYEALGFRVVHRKDNRGEDVAFLKEDVANYDMVLLQFEIPMQINTIVAESFRRFADELEGAADFDAAVTEIIRRTVGDSKVLFARIDEAKMLAELEAEMEAKRAAAEAAAKAEEKPEKPQWKVSVVALIVTALFLVYFFVPVV